MRRYIVLVLSLTVLQLVGFAEDGDLNLRVDAIGNRRSVYTSATDLLGIDLFTPERAAIEKRYRDITAEGRGSKVSGLFADYGVQTLTAEEQIQNRAERMGIFKTSDNAQIYHRPAAETEARVYNPVVVCVAILLLCVAGFFFSRYRFQQKKRYRKNVHNGNN